MNKEQRRPCCGIDVSQLTLDVCYQNNLGDLFHIKVTNNNKGYQRPFGSTQEQAITL